MDESQPSKTGLMARIVYGEHLAKRLHKSLDQVIALFVEAESVKYGKFTTIDEALDLLWESSEVLDLPLTMGIAVAIDEKRNAPNERYS